MGIFEPIWKTKNTEKEAQACEAVSSIKKADKLNAIILQAPLNKVRAAAVKQLKRISGKKYQLEEKACKEILLILEPVTDCAEYYWYESCLLNNLSDNDLYDVAIQAKSNIVRCHAVEKIYDKVYLMLLITGTETPSFIRDAALSRIMDEKQLIEIAKNEALPKDVRESAIKKIKKLACARKGHKKQFIEYVPRQNGGKDARFVCENCGEEILEPYEPSSADSI